MAEFADMEQEDFLYTPPAQEIMHGEDFWTAQEDFLYTPPAQEIMHGEEFWTAYFSVLVPASMKAIKYRVVIKVKCVETKIVEILWAKCPCIGGEGDFILIGILLFA
jgi:hypothetical protein